MKRRNNLCSWHVWLRWYVRNKAHYPSCSTDHKPFEFIAFSPNIIYHNFGKTPVLTRLPCTCTHDVIHDVYPRHLCSTTSRLVTMFPTIHPTTCIHDTLFTLPSMYPRCHPRRVSTTPLLYDLQTCNHVVHDTSHDMHPRYFIHTVVNVPTMSSTTCIHDTFGPQPPCCNHVPHDAFHDVYPRHLWPTTSML